MKGSRAGQEEALSSNPDSTTGGARDPEAGATTATAPRVHSALPSDRRSGRAQGGAGTGREACGQKRQRPAQNGL